MEGSICLQLKPNGSEVLPMHGIEESKGDGVKQSVPDLNDEPLGCSLKEVEFEKKEEIEECRKDGHVDNVKVDELNEDDGKKKRPVEDNVDGKEYNVKKRVKEEGLECKLQFSGRVLRSRSAVKTGSVIEADKVEHRVVKTEDENNSEMKTIEVFTEGNDQSHGEVKGFEKETLELQVGENDCPDGEVRKKIKCKLGRPPKVLDNDRYVKKGFTTAPESDHIDGDVSKESKGKCGRPRKVARKRGRPRKKQDNSGFEKKEFTVEAEESDQSVGGGIKKSNHNLPHVGQVNGQKTRGIEEEADVVKAGESYHSDVEVRKEANHKQESQLKMNVYDGVEMKAAGEGMGEGDHFDCESRKKVMRQRGRPPKFQRKNVFEKKTLKPQVGQNDCPDGEVKKCKRGRPPKVLGNGRYVKKGFTTEARESDRFDGDVSKELKGKRGRPRKVGKRGRPRKVQENSGFENKEIKADAEGGDQSNGGGIKKSNLNLGHGSPVKGQRTRGVEEEADVVKAVESCDSDVEAREVANHKHESPPKMNVDNEVEMKAVDAEMGEGDHFDCESRKKVMHQCGRPPKVQDSDVLLNKQEGIDQCNSKVKEGLLRKSGRPAKLQGGSKGLKGRVINGRKKLSGLRRGRKKLRGSLKFNMPVSTSYSEKRLIGKESNLKRSAIKDRFDDMNKNGSKASLMLSPKFLNAKGNKKGVKKAGDEGELRRSEAKQAVRDRIVNLLKAAGWTIDYRPRNKREYNDAVYVNPEGKTHWSVTLAYRVLKKYYENGDPKSCPNGFVFTPIPEEELSILKRIVQKKRVGKKKPEGDDDDTEDDGQVKKKMNKRKRKWKSNEKKERGTQMCKLQQKQKRKQCALLVRNSMDGAGCDNDGYVLYDGKRTLLSWMIDSGTVPQGGKVEYLIQKRTRTRESKSGSITRDGIRCNCCSDVFSIEEFEIHVGCKFQRPFWNICLDTGVPLLQCLLDAWNKQQQSEIKGIHFVDFGEDPNDDSCGICGDGGDLICCDSCPSAFHQGCLGIEEFPSDNWNCVYCTCKYCGVVRNMSQSDKDDDADPTVLTCQLCEEKYHEPCIQPMDAFDDDSSSAFFCRKRCKELFERLQKLVGVKHELSEGFSWTLVHRFDIGSDVCLNEAYQKVESNSKLAVALSVMDECFLPLVDHRSGINLIHNIVYNFWSNFTRLNYSGFYTAILERGDEIVSAASIRIHGNLLAEMPFIGTRYTYRRQGMCRRLLCAIESALSSLNVEKLVIPAVPELRETWTSVFGFEPLEAACKPKMRNMNMLVFPGVDMLQKQLLAHVTEEQTMDDLPYKSGEKCSVAFDLNVSADRPAPETDDKNDDPAAVESTMPLPDGTSKHTSDIMVETIDLPESATVSSSCIPSPKRKLEFDLQPIYSDGTTDESIVKLNLDSKREDSVKHSDNIVHADNEVAVLFHVPKDASKELVTNGFDGKVQISEDANDTKHHVNSKLQMIECVSGFDKTAFQSEDARISHDISKDATNQTPPSSPQSAQHASNGHFDACNASKCGPSLQVDKMDAPGEVSTPINVNSHTSVGLQ